MDNKLLLVDTREKPKAIKTILAQFDKAGIGYESTKLLFGDYMDYNKPGLVIDRKQNIAELARNCTTDHQRFKKELERAKKAGAELVVLVEQNRYKDRNRWIRVETIEDLILWTGPHTRVNGERIYRVISAWTYKYPLRLEFCNKRTTGKRILEIIYKGETDERRKKELHRL